MSTSDLCLNIKIWIYSVYVLALILRLKEFCLILGVLIISEKQRQSKTQFFKMYISNFVIHFPKYQTFLVTISIYIYSIYYHYNCITLFWYLLFYWFKKCWAFDCYFLSLHSITRYRGLVRLSICNTVTLSFFTLMNFDLDLGFYIICIPNTHIPNFT